MSNNRNRTRSSGRRPVAVPAGVDGEFTFIHKGRSYTLPPASTVVKKVKASVLIDAAISGDKRSAEMDMGLALIAAAADDITPQTLEALRDMDIMTFGCTIGAWMQQTGADTGKSVSSSN